jgi:hypothetical protein
MGYLDDALDVLRGASNSAAGTVSAPVDGIAWLLRKAGLDVGQPVGGSDWMAAKGLTVQPRNPNAGLLGESLGGILPIVAAAKGPQIARGLLSAGENLATPVAAGPVAAQRGAVVWHGSPHLFPPTAKNPLGEFDASKIGTGEGAQDYGHGLYLADVPDVAKEYSKLNPAGGAIPAPERYINGQMVATGTPEYKAASLLESMTLPQSRKLAKSWVDNPSPHDDVEYYKKVFETLNSIPSKSSVKQKAPSGNMYKVDLPDEHIAKMLDWDKPLSQQSPGVQKAWLNTKKRLPANALEDLGGDLSLMYGKDVMPKDFLNTWESFGQNAGGESALRQSGIPGIRYLDGGSRGAGTGTSNYVVFPGNEDMLKILERNGQGLLSP